MIGAIGARTVRLVGGAAVVLIASCAGASNKRVVTREEFGARWPCARGDDALRLRDDVEQLANRGRTRSNERRA